MKTMFIYPGISLLMAFLSSGNALAQIPAKAEMSYLENAQIKLGVNLNQGGAIVYLSRDGGGNLINNFDMGRQVQLSFFFRSGALFEPGTVPGETLGTHWLESHSNGG
jgi:hypothetical protein